MMRGNRQKAMSGNRQMAIGNSEWLELEAENRTDVFAGRQMHLAHVKDSCLLPFACCLRSTARA